jgi:hypothetical protein
MFHRHFCGAMRRPVGSALAKASRTCGSRNTCTHSSILIPPAKVVDYFFEYYGPTNRAYGTLNEVGKKAFHEELTALWSGNNTATDGTTMLPGEYIEVVGTRS